MSTSEPYVLGIAGGSGSGKTTVIRKILEKVSDENAIILQHDWYYKDNPHLSFDERSQLNYDHPEALETSLLISHLKEIVAGRPITAPQYDFSNHLRKKETRLIKPEKIIIVDGILIFRDEKLRDLMDLKIYVDADSDHRFIRRMERDIKERGRTRESVVDQYLRSVKPMHDLFVETSKRYADIIIPHGGKNSVAINLFIAKIESVLANDFSMGSDIIDS
ncbi:uridine kinase [Desulfosediminicola flagellatus]|uniref:uridine kinase n=1 Tax=Desulfosediminicola flagellatus TaxID=2569541 RepID=UPI0010AD7151|nr:uridine kinase [Desulfosediminicola flagellatus]